MRLADFIVENMERILGEWEAFARGLPPGAEMSMADLRDDAEAILRFTAGDMRVRQTPGQQASKSRGRGGAGGPAGEGLNGASALHGACRVGSGFSISEVVAEYRALRASVLRMWREDLSRPELDDIEGIGRFNESLDQSLAVAVDSYSQRIHESRQMFLAILSHDLRNPLLCIRFATQRMKDNPDFDAVREAIDTSADVMKRLINDLIGYTSSELGLAMPLDRSPVDLKALCGEVIDAYHITHLGRTLRFHSDGDISGLWDPGRLRQVVSNLIDNALRHGSPDGPIELSVKTEGSTPEEATVVLSVRNDGDPIPPEALPTIFDPLKRCVRPEEAADLGSGSMGLGLYIVREVVIAEGGTVSVVSTAEEGTTITVRIPKHVPVERDKPGAEAARPLG